MIYFDHAASTPMDVEAYQFLCNSLKEDFANPAAKHKLGKSLNKRIEATRELFLELLGLDQFEVIFTSSATESNNTVIKSFTSNEDILFSMSDHPSVTAVYKDIAGLSFRDNLIEKVNEKTSLVVMTLVNSQNGQIYNVQDNAKLIKEKFPNVKIHVDASQAAFKVNFDFDGKYIDSIAIASHKFGGPKGISALFFKKDFKLRALLGGGGHELNLRSSTPSVSLIESMYIAAKNAQKNSAANYENAKKIKEIIKAELPKLHKNISFPFEGDSRALVSPYILCAQFVGIASDIILRHLEMKEIYISSTTACSSKLSGYNPILDGLGINESKHKNILRISFGLNSTQEEGQEFVVKFRELIKEINFLIK